jgi:hypothetical protein
MSTVKVTNTSKKFLKDITVDNYKWGFAVQMPFSDYWDIFRETGCIVKTVRFVKDIKPFVQQYIK